MIITEEDLTDLGFSLNNVSEEESGDTAYHYYSYDLLVDDDGYAGITLLSCANDEVIDGAWKVELLDSKHHTIWDKEVLINFISACKMVEEHSK